MQALVGSILILAGSVLVASGIIADAIPGYVLGALLGIAGIITMLGKLLRRYWFGSPVADEQKD